MGSREGSRGGTRGGHVGGLRGVRLGCVGSMGGLCYARNTVKNTILRYFEEGLMGGLWGEGGAEGREGSA